MVKLKFAVVVLAFVASAAGFGQDVSPNSFPTAESVNSRVNALEVRIAALEQALATRTAPQASSVGGFALQPGETLVAVDGVPVGQPTWAPASPVYIAPRRVLPLQSVYSSLPYGQMSVSRSLSLPGIRFQSYRTCGPGGCN